MSSKNLKAVALKGNNPPSIFDANLIEQVKRQFREAMEQNTLSMWQKEPPGFSAYIDLSDVETAYMGINNYTDNLHEVIEPFRREKFLEYYKGYITCPGCPNDCITVLDPGSGYTESAGIHQEVSAALGPNIGYTDLKLPLKANVICNRYGLDPVSLEFTLSYAKECFEKGCITSQVTGGLDLRFWNCNIVLPVLEQVTYREIVGDVLAEGVKRCVDHFGRETADCALHVKSIEIVSFEPRTMTNLALGYATAHIGLRYVYL